jgi:hypothetical protein
MLGAEGDPDRGREDRDDRLNSTPNGSPQSVRPADSRGEFSLATDRLESSTRQFLGNVIQNNQIGEVAHAFRKIPVPVKTLARSTLCC